MKDIPEYEKDLASIRHMMERSSKVISLSGLSGVLAGVYALAGAAAAYYVIQYPESPFEYRIYSIAGVETIWKLVGIGSVVLIASLLTGYWLSNIKAKKQGGNLWNAASIKMIESLSIPLVTGGIFIMIMLYTGHFELAAPACLVFYGLALISGSSSTYDEIRYLGFSEIFLGLISCFYPGYGLLAWAFGFGILHIFYGAVMYKKYDK